MPRVRRAPQCREGTERRDGTERGDLILTQRGQRNRRKNEEFRQDMAAMNLDSIRKLSELPDDELIAADPRVPGTTHEMEMQRRFKVAIQALTAVAAGSG
jgi:hypothetical protein